ncbi:FK506-binding protein-like [Nematostella vectensis]|uniref:FK506-binding protein-like n=1 Tax=Nematostella vectensis TaxID=45351 RepID=UPI0020770286|nr:FK506-binding protein-like [Nematostella vectensis]
MADGLLEMTKHKRKNLETPNLGSVCKVRLVRSIKGECLEENEKTITIGEGNCDWSEMIDSCLESMHAGETCTVEERHPLEKDETLHLELLSFERAKDVWRLSASELLQLAEYHKVKGTEFFKTGNWLCAARCYSRAAKMLIISQYDLQDEQKTNYDQLRNACYLNLAACQGKLHQNEHVIANCSKVLQSEDTNIKALYRRAQAYLELDEIDKSREDIEKALQVDPGNTAVRDLMSTLKQKKRTQDAVLTRALAPMFRSDAQNTQ